MPLRLGNGDSGDSDGLPLTNDDETRIEWGDFATVSLGILAGEFYSGLARFLASVLTAFLIDPIRGATEYASGFVYELVGAPAFHLNVAFGNETVPLPFTGTNTLVWVQQNPIVGFAVSVMLAFGLAYLASRVIPRG